MAKAAIENNKVMVWHPLFKKHDERLKSVQERH